MQIRQKNLIIPVFINIFRKIKEYITEKHYIFIIFISMNLVITSLSCIPKKESPEKQSTQQSITRSDQNISHLKECISFTLKDLKKTWREDQLSGLDSFQTLFASAEKKLKKMKKRLPVPTHPALVDTMISIIYSQWGITFDPDKDNIHGLVPHRVLATKKGSCLGVSLLFLLLAEKIDYPLYGVLLPGHFMVRYVDGLVQRNIEPNRRGYNHPDSYYRQSYGIINDSWYRLQTLSKTEIMAIWYYNIANLCRNQGAYALARKYYYLCLQNFPQFAEAWGNLALTYYAQDNLDSADYAFTNAYNLRPHLEQLAYNFSAFKVQQKKFDEAITILHNGLSHSPGDTAILYSLAYVYYSLGKAERALPYLEKMAPVIAQSQRGTALLALVKKALNQNHGITAKIK